MDLALAYTDRMALRLRDLLRADAQVSTWADSIERIEYPMPRSAASPWLDVSVVEMGVVKSDGASRCTEMMVVLGIGISHRQLDVDIADTEGSYAALAEAIFAVVRTGQGLQDGAEILAKGVERIEQVRFDALESGDRVTIYRQVDVEYRVAVDPETWQPRASG